MTFTDAGALTINECRDAGRQAGRNAASWVDVPRPGEELPREFDWVGVGTVQTPLDAAEAFALLAHAGEENARCYSPWECIAAAINKRELVREGAAEEGWEAYEQGVQEGIAAVRRRRLPLNATSRWWGD